MQTIANHLSTMLQNCATPLVTSINYSSWQQLDQGGFTVEMYPFVLAEELQKRQLTIL